MNEVWILTCDWCFYGDSGHDIVIVAKSKETCIAQMHKEIQHDIEEHNSLKNYVYLDENDKENPYKLIKANSQDDINLHELGFSCDINHDEIYVKYMIDRYFIS